MELKPCKKRSLGPFGIRPAPKDPRRPLQNRPGTSQSRPTDRLKVPNGSQLGAKWRENDFRNCIKIRNRFKIAF